MCGITGKIYFQNNNKLVSENDIVLMNSKIAHRGPDDSGIFVSQNNKVGLGQQRLSIIDLSPAGHQPMDYKNRYKITFNGEIYNFQEKRKMLEDLGCHFNSHSDTEVILALYDKFKEKCLEHLRGMFAFAIYDKQTQTLFCARDRLGKKPFKYFQNSNTFIFASELKAILTQSDHSKEPDYEAIHHYLTLQYVPHPLTGFKDIKKLEPAHYLMIDCKTGKTEKKQYWKLDYSKKINLSEIEWEKKILDKLEESVKLRMISDVPLGAFLSGGIDSSAIVALMAKNSSNPIKTFSIGFEEASHDERQYAQLIAQKYKTDHNEFVVKPDAMEVLPFLVKQYEEPYADSSALPTYYLSKMTRDYVTVTLNGDGGDENFAGYPWYSINKFSLFYEKFLPIHNLLIKPSVNLASKLIKNNFLERSQRFSEMINDSYEERYINYIAYFTTKQKNNIYVNEFKNKFINNKTEKIIAKFLQEAKNYPKNDQVLYTDINSYLPDDLLVKVDIATMAVALESRSPFLDHEFMEMTAQIPFNLKLKGLNNKKYILKKALEKELVPKEILYRKKQGFGVPINSWFKNELKNFTHKTLLSKTAISRNIFKRGAIEKLLKIHETTQINHAPRIWALLTLEMWFQEYFD